MSFSEIVLGVLLATAVGLMTRGSVRRQATRQPAERPAEGPMTLLGVVPPPRGEAHLDGTNVPL